jgi:hypothetical protein
MLIVTHTGVVVSSDHIAYIALKKQRPLMEGHQAECESGSEPRFKVLLVLSNRDALVAADNLTDAAARFLRAQIMQTWTAGNPILEVIETLQQQAGGAYYAQEANITPPTQEGEEIPPDAPSLIVWQGGKNP